MPVILGGRDAKDLSGHQGFRLKPHVFRSPYRHGEAYDIKLQAMGGLISINGQPDGSPTKVGPAIADKSGGTYAIVAIPAGLQYGNRTGL